LIILASREIYEGILERVKENPPSPLKLISIRKKKAGIAAIR